MTLPSILNTMLLFSNNVAKWLFKEQTIRIFIGLLEPVGIDAIPWLDYQSGFLIFQTRPIELLGYLLGVLFLLMVIKKVVPLA